MEWGNILSASVIAVVVSSMMNFGFQLYFDKRKSRERDLLEIKENDKIIIKELYGPILNILGQDIIPGDGYEGVDSDQLTSIRNIIDINPHLVDVELDHITYSFVEELMHLGRNQSIPPSFEKFIDFDRKLMDHVLSMYNTKRKNLNLPYNKSAIKN